MTQSMRRFAVVTVACALALVARPIHAQPRDQCVQGYVWREAVSGDHVCVKPSVRDSVARQNAAAAQRRLRASSALAVTPPVATSPSATNPATNLAARRAAVAPNVSRIATPVPTPGALTPPIVQQPAVQKAISRERISAVLGKSSAGIRIVRASGVSDLAADASSVGIAPGEFVFRKFADTAHRIPVAAETPQVRPSPPTPTTSTTVVPASNPAIGRGAATFVMPYRWFTVDSAGTERVLVPFFILASGGLTYDVNTRTYRGVALVGVEDTLHATVGAITLPRPLKLMLTTTNGGTVMPVQLAIGHTSLEYDSVSIESPDSTNVRIRTGADPVGIIIPIPVRSLTVAMTPAQTTLQGFGLGTTDIAIALPRGVTRRDTATITFSSSGAPVHPSSVKVIGAEGATIRLRSGVPGRDSIRAYLDGVFVGEAVITFARPWIFLGAMVTGLFLGGFARFFGAKRRKRASALQWDILKGAPFGVFAAIAGAIGFDAVNLKLDEPAALPAIVITTALGAWLGSRVLDGSPRPST